MAVVVKGSSAVTRSPKPLRTWESPNLGTLLGMKVYLIHRGPKVSRGPGQYWLHFTRPIPLHCVTKITKQKSQGPPLDQILDPPLSHISVCIISPDAKQLMKLYLHNKTRKSCVNARGIPPAMYTRPGGGGEVTPILVGGYHNPGQGGTPWVSSRGAPSLPPKGTRDQRLGYPPQRTRDQRLGYPWKGPGTGVSPPRKDQGLETGVPSSPGELTNKVKTLPSPSFGCGW